MDPRRSVLSLYICETIPSSFSRRLSASVVGLLPGRSWTGMQSAPSLKTRARLDGDKPIERLSVPHRQALRVVSVCSRNAAIMENVATRRLALGGRRLPSNQAVAVRAGDKRAMAAAERAASPDTLPVCLRNAATMRLWKLAATTLGVRATKRCKHAGFVAQCRLPENVHRFENFWLGSASYLFLICVLCFCDQVPRVLSLK